MSEYMSRQECQLAHQELRRSTDSIKADLVAYNLAAQTWMTKLSENTLALSRSFSEHLTETDDRIKKYDAVVEDYHTHKTTEITAKEIAKELSEGVTKRQSTTIALRALYVAATGTFFSIAWIIYQIYNGLRLKGVI